MRNYKTLSFVLLISITFFFFMEAFYNVLVNTNAYIFMNFSNFIIIIPSLIFLVAILIVEFLFFTRKRIPKIYRVYILIYIIVGLRIATQFIIIPNIIFILNFIMVFSLLIFFVGIILFIENNRKVLNFSHFLASIIIGLGIQYILLIVDTSSNLTSNSSKIIPTFIFVGLLIVFNNLLFYPRLEHNYNMKASQVKYAENKISLFQFIILGILFLYSMMWIFNPMALSAYDVINLNINGLIYNTLIFWPTFGFTYYILLILFTVIVSYVLTIKCLRSLRIISIKIICGVLALITCFLTVFSNFIIKAEKSFFSSIYISISAIVGVSFVVFYISYLVHFYSFNSSKKLIAGIFVFFITAFFFIILQVEILLDEYLSLLFHASIQIISLLVLLFLYEIRFLKRNIVVKEQIIGLNKMIAILFAFLLIFSGITISISAQQRIIKPSQNENLTFMVWNIHNAIGDDDVFQLDRIVDQIKENNPDILGLNEVDMGALKTSFIDMPSYFAYKLNMYYFYGYTFYKHYGNVVLSKYPILSAEIIPLPLAMQSAEPRSVIRARIQINSSVWTIFITHLSTESKDRLVQVPFIVNRINQESLFEKIVWMGNFNLEPSSTAYSLINITTSLNFTDTYRYLNLDPGLTAHFNENHIPQKRIDYIMSSPDIIPIQSEVFCSIASDHCAVITRFL